MAAIFFVLVCIVCGLALGQWLVGSRRSADAFPEPDPKDIEADADDDDDDDDENDVCLRVGMRVICNLSAVTHTHGVLIGFAMHTSPDGPMLAVVDVGGAQPMPIDVDLIEPSGPPPGPMPGYRDNANTNKQWN